MAQRRAERLDIGRKSRFTPLARTAVHSGPPIRKKIAAKYHILRSLDTQIHDVEFCDSVRLSWHLSLCEIQASNWEGALRAYRDAIALDRHSGGPQPKISDGAAFLWRAELAGHPRDPAAWRGLYDYANSALSRPGNGLADLQVILAQAIMGDDAALDVRARQMQELAREGRYPSGSYLPALARGFASLEREDFSGAIEALAPVTSYGKTVRTALAEWATGA